MNSSCLRSSSITWSSGLTPARVRFRTSGLIFRISPCLDLPLIKPDCEILFAPHQFCCFEWHSLEWSALRRAHDPTFSQLSSASNVAITRIRDGLPVPLSMFPSLFSTIFHTSYPTTRGRSATIPPRSWCRYPPAMPCLVL